MIEKINKELKKMGSHFSTDDGHYLILCVKGLVFLKTWFETPDEMYAYVQCALNQNKKTL